MGGEGSMQSMNTILRNNRSLLRKKSMFKKERTFMSIRKEYYKAIQGNIEFKNLSKEELQRIRKKIIKQRRIQSIKAWSISFVLIVPLVIFSISAINNSLKNKNKLIETAKDNYLNENLNEYTYFIDEGDLWIEKRNWNNAIYRYEQAVKLFPKEYEANYRLALAYSYQCTYEKKGCKKGKALTKRLLKYFPKNTDLLLLEKNFEK